MDMQNQQKKVSPCAGLLGAGTAGLCATGLGLGIYAAKIEPEMLGVTVAPLDKTPPVRAVFFSDLHLSHLYHFSHLEKIVDSINDLQPQLVLFGGDFFGHFLKEVNSLPFRWLADQLRRINAPLGKFAVMGNHEMREGAWPFFELLFTEGGFQVLRDEIVQPAPGITICGLSPFSKGKVLRQMPKDGWRVVLCHMPDKCRYLNLKNTDLVLSGHTHAGQIRLPVVTRMVLPPGGRRYPYGSYHPQGDHTAQLFVSRGIGMSGVPFRFLAPPELVLLES